MSRTARLTVALAAGFAVNAGLVGVLAGRLSAAALTAAACLGALLFALVSAGAPLVALRRLGSRRSVLAAVGGLACVWAAPALVAANRLSDAPSGSVTVFWTTAGWAAVATSALAVRSLLAGRRAEAGRRVAAAIAFLAGAAGVLANWERPSSFSPLIKFAGLEAWMIVAGVLFVAGGLAVARAAGDEEAPGAFVAATAVAAIASAGQVMVTGWETALASATEQPASLVLVGAAWAVVAWSWTSLVARDDVPRAAVALAAVPALLSLLTIVEQVVGAAGPQPLILPGVAAGALVSATGAAALLSDGGTAAPRWRGTVSLVALVVSLAALAAPAIDAAVRADRSGVDYALSWTMAGWESVAVWSAVALSACMLASVGTASRSVPWIALAACGAWPALLSVPTHVLTTWIPPDVQQDYGTEYATIGFAGLHGPATFAVVLVAVVALAWLLVALSERFRSDPRKADV